jgi:hypothetical protein
VKDQIDEANAQLARMVPTALTYAALTSTLLTAGIALVYTARPGGVVGVLAMGTLACLLASTILLVHAAMPDTRGDHGIAGVRSGAGWGDDAVRLAWISKRAMDGFRLIRMGCHMMEAGLVTAFVAAVVRVAGWG